MRASTFAWLFATLVGCASAPPAVQTTSAALAPAQAIVRVDVGRVEVAADRRNGVDGVTARINPIVDPPQTLDFEVTFERDGRPIASSRARYRRPSGRVGTEVAWVPNAAPVEVFVPFSALELASGRQVLTATVAVRARAREVRARVVADPPASVELDVPRRVDVRFLVRRMELARNRRYDEALTGGLNPPDPKWKVRYDGEPVCTGQTVDDRYFATWSGHCRSFRMSETDDVVLDALDSDTVVDDLLARFRLDLPEMAARTESGKAFRSGAVEHLEIDVQIVARD